MSIATPSSNAFCAFRINITDPQSSSMHLSDWTCRSCRTNEHCYRRCPMRPFCTLCNKRRHLEITCHSKSWHDSQRASVLKEKVCPITYGGSIFLARSIPPFAVPSSVVQSAVTFVVSTFGLTPAHGFICDSGCIDHCCSDLSLRLPLQSCLEVN